MTFESFKLLAVFLISIVSLVTLLVSDWRVTISSLAVQFAGAFLLIGLEWPFALAVTTLIAGWLSGAILGHGCGQYSQEIFFRLVHELCSNQRLNPLYNFLAAVLIYLLVVIAGSSSPKMAAFYEL